MHTIEKKVSVSDTKIIGDEALNNPGNSTVHVYSVWNVVIALPGGRFFGHNFFSRKDTNFSPAPQKKFSPVSVSFEIQKKVFIFAR
jgi:hypothetical protein